MVHHRLHRAKIQRLFGLAGYAVAVAHIGIHVKSWCLCCPVDVSSVGRHLLSLNYSSAYHACCQVSPNIFGGYSTVSYLRHGAQRAKLDPCLPLPRHWRDQYLRLSEAHSDILHEADELQGAMAARYIHQCPADSPLHFAVSQLNLPAPKTGSEWWGR